MSVTVDVLSPGFGSLVVGGSATVAVFTTLPLAPALMLAVTVKVAVPLTSRLTRAPMLPDPLAGPLEPAE